MQNKLQELTDKLYNEGLSKGKQEAEDMKAKAKADAATIISDAKEKAKEIIVNAQKESEELKAKAQSDIKMASGQAFAAIRQQIEKAIITKAVSAQISDAVKETEFLKTIITTIVTAFKSESSEPTPLNIILPENKKIELDAFIQNQLAKICSAGVTVSFNKNIENGFKIGPENGGYLISFTDKDFESLISEYLRPKTRTLLFGE